MGYRRRDGEVHRWKGLANQARAEGQALQAKRDEEAALYAEQVWPGLQSAMPQCMPALLSANSIRLYMQL